MEEKKPKPGWELLAHLTLKGYVSRLLLFSGVYHIKKKSSEDGRYIAEIDKSFLSL